MPDLLAPLGVYRDRSPLLALSGGADSVALLRALLAVEARPVAAHLDHRLRPESADDARWVADLCAALSVPLVSEAVDVAAVAARGGLNLEAAARTLRYAFLARAARARGLQTILTAHTRDDLAETVLWQLLRGEPTLKGIAPERGHLRRPWLDVSRAEIETYLRGLNQDWREDVSNADPRFTRNWLRHGVLPLLRAREPGLDRLLARHARWQREDDTALGGLAARVPKRADLGREPPAVRRRVLAAQLRAAKLSFHGEHLQQLSEALGSGATHHLDLPGARSMTVTGGRLVTAPRTFSPPEFPIPPGLTLRHRAPGDRIRRPGGTRKLSDLLTDLKVPRGDRDRLWLLADGPQVIWVGLEPPVWAHGTGEHPAPPWHAEMGEALAEARSALSAGEVPVGAVLVRAGSVVARGRNRSRERGDMTRHAELEALRAATAALGTPYLTDCTLVVTLEPCPMCFGAMIEARLGRVVYGAPNPKLGALGGVSDLNRAGWGQRLEVVPGVRAGEAGRLLSQFFAERRGGAGGPPEDD